MYFLKSKGTNGITKHKRLMAGACLSLKVDFISFQPSALSTIIEKTTY